MIFIYSSNEKIFNNLKSIELKAIEYVVHNLNKISISEKIEIKIDW